MRYRNKTTGAIVNFTCQVSGDNWEKCKGEAKAPPSGIEPQSNTPAKKQTAKTGDKKKGAA